MSVSFEQEGVRAFAFDVSALQSDGVTGAPIGLVDDLNPGAKSHQVYNFEVAEHHTYIADGTRVHNTSVLGMLNEYELANLTGFEDSDDAVPGLDYAVVDFPDGRGKTVYKTVEADGAEYVEVYHTYVDANGDIVQSKLVRDKDLKVVSEPVVTPLTGAQFGEQVGTLITPYLTAAIIGEDASAFEKIAANTILGTFVENIFEAGGGMLHALLDSDVSAQDHLDNIAKLSFQDIEAEFLENAAGYTSQALTNWIMAEVFGGIATDNFGGALINTLASEGVGFLVDKSLHHLATEVFNIQNEDFLSGFSPDATLKDMFSAPNIGGMLMSTALNRILPAIETIEGQLAQGLTSLAIATFAKSVHALGAIGSFHPVTFVISYVVGKIFDSLFEKHPEAYTNVIFNEDTGLFEVGTSWSNDGGDTAYGQSMAASYVAFMNGLLDQSQAQSHNAAELAETLKLVFGHYEENIRNGAERNFGSLDEAMQSRIIDSVQELNLNDGDLLVGEAVNDIGLRADFVDDITHFGSYYTWKKIFFIKISKRWHFTEINEEATDGMTTEELVEVVQGWSTAGQDHDFEVALLAQFNSIYGDIQLSSLDDAQKVEQILNRISSGSWDHNLKIMRTFYERHREDGDTHYTTYTVPDKDRAIDIIGDALYIRGIVIQLSDRGYTPVSKVDLIAAIEQEQLIVESDPALFAELQHAMQIAAEYREYLQNQSAYDSAIQAAGANSAYAQAWALTFMEAERLGFTQSFDAMGDEVNNLFLASSGDDTIGGSTGDDTIKTYSGEDFLDGHEGNDLLDGGAGNDTLSGGTGNDVLIGGSGADNLVGGEGADAASYATSAFAVEIDLAADLISGGDAEGDSFTSIENVFGSSLSDRLTGDENANELRGGAGDDTLFGLEGDDLLYGGDGNDYLNGGPGQDSLYGGEGDDVFVLADGAAFIDGGSGLDLVSYSSAPSSVQVYLSNDGFVPWMPETYGDEVLIGIEHVIGSAHDDIIDASGRDRLFHPIERAFASTTFGFDGRILDGDAGDDTIIGGEYSDILIGGEGADLLDGGEGLNIVAYLESNAGVHVDISTGLATGGDAEGDYLIRVSGVVGSNYADRLIGKVAFGCEGNDTLESSESASKLDGGNGDDLLSASGERSALSGGNGQDSLMSTGLKSELLGGDGDDLLRASGERSTLSGGNGSDTLIGGAGEFNSLIGGADHDYFLFENGFNNERILDFEAGVDKIKIYGAFTSRGELRNCSIQFGDDVRLLFGDKYLIVRNTFVDELVDGIILFDDLGNEIPQEPIQEPDLGGGESSGDSGEGVTILSSAREDMLNGSIWNDELVSSGVKSKLDGGSGNDTLESSGRLSTLIGGNGHDNLASTGNRSVLDGGDGHDSLIGTGYGGVLDGGEGNDTLESSGPESILFGGVGNDLLTASGYKAILNGGAGNDTLAASAIAEESILIGGADADKFIFEFGNEEVWIEDFEDGIDAIELKGFGTDLDEVLSNASESSGDVVLDFGGRDLLRIENTTLDALSDDIILT